MNPSKGRPEKPVGSLTPRFFSKGTPAASAHLTRVLRPATARPPDGSRQTEHVDASTTRVTGTIPGPQVAIEAAGVRRYD